MKDSKPKSLNKIILYKMCLLERFLTILSAIGFVSLPIACLILGIVNLEWKVIILILASIVYSVIVYLSVFKEYICLDIKNDKLVISNGPRYREEAFFINDILSIEISGGYSYTDFTIDVNMKGYTEKISTWSTPPYNKSLIIGNRMQRQRLEKFCEECNAYLESRDKKIG